jgi:hypothetical protein
MGYAPRLSAEPCRRGPKINSPAYEQGGTYTPPAPKLMHPPMTQAERREAWPHLDDQAALELERQLRQRDEVWLTGAEPPVGPPRRPPPSFAATD